MFSSKLVLQLAFLLLIGSGIVAGVLLVQQRQEIREKAYYYDKKDGYCLETDWINRSGYADLPDNSRSFRSYDHVVLPNDKLKQTVIAPDGKSLYVRYFVWSNGSWSLDQNWSQRTNDFPDPGRAYWSFDHAAFPNNDLKQTAIADDGKTIWSRKLTGWDGSGWSTIGNWENRTNSADLPNSTEKFRSYDHVVFPDNRLKQTVLSNDGITLHYRYFSWNSGSNSWNLVGNWEKTTTDNPNKEFQYITADYEVWPNNELKQTALLSDGKTLFFKYYTWSPSSDCPVVPMEVKVNITTPGSTKIISPNIWGVNGEALPDMTANEFFANYPNVNKLGIKIIRYPGGCFAESFDWQSHSSKFYRKEYGSYYVQNIMSIDEVLKVADVMGSQLLYVLNISNSNSAGGCTNDTSKKLPFTGSINDALSILIKYKGRIKYFEIGNEPYFLWRNITPSVYKQLALDYARTLKAEDNTIKLGIVGYYPDAAWNSAVKSILTQSCSGKPCFDYVTDHHYAGYYAGYSSSWGDVPHNYLGKSSFYPPASYEPLLSKLVDSTYSPKPVSVTEWNLHCWNSITPSHHTVEHGLYAAENFILFAKKDVSIANFHDLVHTQISFRTGNCGLFAEDNKKLTPPAQAFQLTSVMSGKYKLNSVVDGPLFNIPTDPHNAINDQAAVTFVNVLSGYSSDNNVYFIATNKHATRPANVKLSFNGIFSMFGKSKFYLSFLNAGSFTSTGFNKSTSTIAINNNSANLVIQPNSIIVGATKQLPPTPTTIPTPTPTKVPTSTPTGGCQPGTVPGDANGDCNVDGFDYVVWWQNFGNNVSGGYTQGDFNGNGSVDGFDYVVWWQNFGG